MLSTEFPKKNLKEFYQYQDFQNTLIQSLTDNCIDNALELFDSFFIEDNFYPLSEDPLISSRSHAISLISILSHITIQKGFSPYSVRAKSQAMITLINNEDNINKIIHITRVSVKAFCLQMSKITITEEDIRIRAAINYVHDHLGEKLSLEDVANHAYISRCHLCTLFKELTGISFSAYIREARIERSKILLSHTEMTISEISLALGFSNQAYYTAVFSKSVGVPPGKFREDNKGSYVKTVEEFKEEILKLNKKY